MKKLLLGLLVVLFITSCNKEEDKEEINKKIKIDILFNSAYGEMKLDETDYHIKTNGDILDTINNSTIIEICELDEIEIKTKMTQELNVKLTNDNGDIYNYEINGYIYLISYKDSFIRIN